jgi:hypothetical protein
MVSGQAQHNKRHAGPTMTHSLIVLQAHMLGHDRMLDHACMHTYRAYTHEPSLEPTPTADRREAIFIR